MTKTEKINAILATGFTKYTANHLKKKMTVAEIDTLYNELLTGATADGADGATADGADGATADGETVTAENEYLADNSRDIEKAVFDTFKPLFDTGLIVRRWQCNKNLYTFYSKRVQIAEITFRRKDFRIACRPVYATDEYGDRKSGYGLDKYVDKADLEAAVAEITAILKRYTDITAKKAAEKAAKKADTSKTEKETV